MRGGCAYPRRLTRASIEVRAGGKETIERFPAVNHYVQQVEAFGRTVRDGVAYAWTLEDAQGTQRLIDAVYASASAQ